MRDVEGTKRPNFAYLAAQRTSGAIPRSKDAHPDGRRTRHDQEHGEALTSARSLGPLDGALGVGRGDVGGGGA